MKRREFIAGVGAATTWPVVARGQQQSKPLIAVLSPISAAAAARNVEALRQGLHDLGYDEGRDFVFALRFMDGDLTKAAAISAELVALKVDVIVAGAATPVIEAHKATRTIPIVMSAMSGDLQQLGLAHSLAQPDGNVTGLLFAALTASGSLGLVGKRLALLRELLPGLAKVGFVFNPDDAQDKPSLEVMPEATRGLHLDGRLYEVRNAGDLEPAFAALAHDGAEAIYVKGSPLFNLYRMQVAKVIALTRRPAIGAIREQALDGCLMSYGPSIADSYRRSAAYVAKILRGATPGDLPIEQPTKFDLTINTRVAKELGLTVPDKLIAIADEVIE